MSNLTICSDVRLSLGRRGALALSGLVSVLVLGTGCGKKVPEAPTRPTPTIDTDSTPPELPSPIPPSEALDPLLSWMDRVAASPRIRIGLSSSEASVTLTAAKPFQLGAGDQWIQTQDVLIEIERGVTVEGSVFAVELGSASLRSAAESMRSRLSEELESSIRISREPGSGRFLLRTGSFGTREGAVALASSLARSGVEPLRVVNEPRESGRPRQLVLRPAGRAPLYIDVLGLTAIPAERTAFLEVDGVPYRGYLEVFVNATNRFTIVNVAHLEDYLRGVVPAELSPAVFPQLEAVKAQAVAARTYAVRRLGEFESEGYDICATPACQVYGGVSVEQPMSDEAVAQTMGEVLTYDGELIEALYTSTCGGRTENAENVFETEAPYLVSRACFLESEKHEVEAVNDGPLGQPAAELQLLGILQVPDPAWLNGSADWGESERWLNDTLRHLGQQSCNRGGGGAPPGRRSPVLDATAWAGMLAQALCWERRLPFLFSARDAERFVPGRALSSAEDRRQLAYAIREELLKPHPEGLLLGKPLRRADVVESLHRLLETRGTPFLSEARLVGIAGDGLILTEPDRAPGSPELEKMAMSLSPRRYFYRQIGEAAFYVPSLELLPDDRLLYHRDDTGIDLLVLITQGASFDRSSRFSHWVVRKEKAELEQEIRLRHPIGELRELRPRRYGRSGRVVELEVVTSTGSTILEGLAIRRAFGLRENLFFIDVQRAEDGRALAWVFSGRGWGHGVGLCQVGAYGMAASGYDHRQILAHYYLGTQVTQRDQLPQSPKTTQLR